MRIVILLIVLAIVGLLVTQHINTPPPDISLPDATQDRPAPPQVPTRSQDVDAFGEQMQRFNDEAAARRQQQLEQATQ